MRKLTMAILCSTALALGACGSAGKAGAPSNALSIEQTTQIDSADGIDASKLLFSSSTSVVIAGGSVGQKWEGAKEAVKRGAPLLVRTADNASAIDSEIKRLGAQDVIMIDEPQTLDPEISEANIADKISQLTPESPLFDGGASILVSGHTTAADVATARASGAKVEYLSSGDARESSTLSADPDAHVVALGPSFANKERFNRQVEMINYGEVPGGGHLIFPSHRVVALYGHPSGGALGVLGEQPAEEAVNRVNDLVGKYQAIDPEESVIPAFEIIATVASSSAGPDGNYSNEGNVDELRPWVKAIGDAGGIAILDLQPGSASFLEQAQQFEELLKLPHVGLAIDPEWRLKPGEKPMERVGSVGAGEVNQTAAWLRDLVKDNELPQKVFVVHQFQHQMVQDRETLDTTAPELSWVLHADGHGTAGDKFATWDMVRKNLQPEFYLAWKNFIDEDQPMFTPEQTFKIEPRPWFVSYQ